MGQPTFIARAPNYVLTQRLARLAVPQEVRVEEPERFSIERSVSLSFILRATCVIERFRTDT
jgi:hypothetical protein